MLEAKGCGGCSNRDPAALQKADADEIASGWLYGIACVYLAGEVGNGDRVRMGVENQAQNGSLSRHP
jgi:hypothetical protein